jgi:hypothetical protein
MLLLSRAGTLCFDDDDAAPRGNGLHRSVIGQIAALTCKTLDRRGGGQRHNERSRKLVYLNNFASLAFGEDEQLCHKRRRFRAICSPRPPLASLDRREWGGL